MVDSGNQVKNYSRLVNHYLSAKSGLLVLYNLVASLATWYIWRFVVGPIVSLGLLVWLILHECGHMLAMKMLNLSPRIIVVPALGAMVLSKSRPKTESDAIVVALAGAGAGVLVLLTVVFGARAAHVNSLSILVVIVAYANLFNLAPITLMDGNEIYDSLQVSSARKKGKLIIVGLILTAIATIVVFIGFSITSTLITGLFVLKLAAVLKSAPRWLQRPPLSPRGIWIATATYWTLFFLSALAIQVFGQQGGLMF